MCNRILTVINHTTNNSANYLKKVPVILDEKYFDEINELVEGIFQEKELEKAWKELMRFFFIECQINARGFHIPELILNKMMIPVVETKI